MRTPRATRVLLAGTAAAALLLPACGSDVEADLRVVEADDDGDDDEDAVDDDFDYRLR
ncbi:hypothetical protein GCM10009616_04990 [Microlunatus lacustris]